MAYNFTDKSLAEFLNYVFNVTDGHDHDGTNSKAVTTATPSAGSVTKTVLAAGALAADATGRAVMATDFFNAATVLAKFAADSFTNANLLDIVQDGAFVADASTRALFASGFVNLALMASTAKTHVFTYSVEDLSAGADIASRAVLVVPTGLEYTLTSAIIISNGTAAGIDDSNTCVVALADNSANAICSLTMNTGTPFPASNATSSLGTLDGTYKVLSAGEALCIAVTNGVTANPPAFRLQVTYTVADA